MQNVITSLTKNVIQVGRKSQYQVRGLRCKTVHGMCIQAHYWWDGLGRQRGG